MGRVLYGTSSWSEPSWKGVFYPKGMKAGDSLVYYATRYPTVEADVTYYRIPTAQMTDAWERKTPAGFILSAKFPRSIVHAGEQARPDPAGLLVPEQVWPDVEEFLAAMGRLGPKCGPLVLQFPYFNRQVFSSAGPFLDRLDMFLGRLPDRFRYAVEIRNKAWFGEPYLAILRRHRCAPVLVDLSYLPHPAALVRDLDLLTTDFAYVRLIGDRQAVEERTETFDRIVVDRTSRLRHWAALIRSMQERVATTLVYANNHYAGHAPTTIDQLAGLVGGNKAAAN